MEYVLLFYVGRTGNAYRILVGKSREHRRLEDPGADESHHQ
jgi:hypothetical protein